MFLRWINGAQFVKVEQEAKREFAVEFFELTD